jgi:hypothetical protein
MRRILSLFAAIVLAGCGATPATVRPLAYDGWLGAYRIDNGTVDVVVVPEIGRVIRYGRVGGDNLLWENPALRGKTTAPQPGKWANFGGEKIYPWPQADWTTRFGKDWPPPPGVDPLSYRAKVMPDGTLRLTSDVLPAFGVRVVREFRLAPRGTVLNIETTFEQILPPQGDWPIAVWSVAQWRSPDVIVAKRSTPRTGPMLAPFRGEFDSIRTTGSQTVVLERPLKDSAKVGLDADVLAVRLGEAWVTERIPPPAPNDPGSTDRAQIYCTTRPVTSSSSSYVELEFTSTRRRLSPGQILRLNMQWELQTRDDAPDAE